MGNIRLYGSTSGYTELAPPAVAPDGVLSLPSGVGTLLTAEGGKVLQVVRATDTTARTTTSSSFVDVTGLSVTITPQKSDSAVLLIAVVSGLAPDNSLMSLRITDSSNNQVSGTADSYLGALATGMNTFRSLQTLFAYSTPATTSAVTYKLRFRTIGSGTATVDNANNTGQLFAIEVSA